jgi:hypothetical protein
VNDEEAWYFSNGVVAVTTFAYYAIGVVHVKDAAVPTAHLGVAAAALVFLPLYCLVVWFVEVREPPKNNLIASPRPPKALLPSAIRFISLIL